jgi:ATP-dependent helicase/DNAse subunit B
MGLTLLAGPANAGKVALLLERYLGALGSDPVLIVPNRPDVERAERDLLRRAGCLLGGTVGTFDDLFDELAKAGAPKRVLQDRQRDLLVRRVVSATPLNGLSASARTAGFADSLSTVLSDLEAGLLTPDELADEHLAALYRGYRAELERLDVWDRDLRRVYAAERLSSEFEAWDGRPVFAYGFEDLTAAEWRLLSALAGRTDVTVSLPYEPGRPAFASLARTAEDLSRLAGSRIEELPPRYGDYAHPALAHLERALFADVPPAGAPELDGAVRWLEGAGTRATLERVGEEIVRLIRAGTDASEIAVVCPSLERVRAPLDTAFTTLGVPYGLEGQLRLGQSALGHALLSLLAFDWRDGGRRELYAFLRSPYSGIPRHNVDFLEGRLRGRAIDGHQRVDEETLKLRGQPVTALDALRREARPVAAVRAIAAFMLRAAYGTEAPPTTEAARVDLRAYDAVVRVLDELDEWEALSEADVTREDVLAGLERTTLRVAGAGEPGRVAVVDLLRARTRQFDVVFVLGLEEGSLPRRESSSPFLPDDERQRLEPGARLTRPDPASRDRYLFYTACTRARQRLLLVREAATDDGSPREPSPFWDETRAAFPDEDVARATERRPLSALTWPLHDAPTERERLRSLLAMWSKPEDRDVAEALAAANAWERRLQRARRSFTRTTELRHPWVIAQLQERTTFPATELERFADCSSAWFVERFLDPKTIDAEVDAKLKGSIAHNALFKFFSGLPRELGSDNIPRERVEDAVRFMLRCLSDAVDGVRMEMTPIQRLELQQTLARDLEALVRDEAETDAPLVPRRFEVAFGNDRAAPELQRGIDLGDGLRMSGKIDRIDVDPMSARGIVQDYKSGKSAHSAQQIHSELRLQIPLYMLVLRDLVGIEPLGGVYRPLAGDRKARGLLRAEAKDDVLGGYAKNDYLEEEEFWGTVEAARQTAGTMARRLRSGDVKHDPKGDLCPAWCDLWTVCRVRRG